MTPPINQPEQPVEVRLTDATIDYLEKRLEESMRRVIKESINEESAKLFWEAGIKVLRKEATEHTGRFILGGLGSLMTRAFTFLLLGSLVYAIGGWSGLAKLWQMLFSGAGQ